MRTGSEHPLAADCRPAAGRHAAVHPLRRHATPLSCRPRAGPGHGTRAVCVRVCVRANLAEALEELLVAGLGRVEGAHRQDLGPHLARPVCVNRAAASHGAGPEPAANGARAHARLGAGGARAGSPGSPS